METKKNQTTRLQRWFPHPLLTVTLIVLWLLLLNSFTAGGLVVGTVLGIVISRIASSFWPERPRLRSYSRMLLFVIMVAWDVAVANVQVAWLILFRPNNKLHSRWVTVPLELTSKEAITAMAATITLTPGTVSSDLSADGRSLLVHCLDAPDAEAAVRWMKTRYEARLKVIYS
jgi:multicomponent K+:H+ antiporter subunit E